MPRELNIDAINMIANKVGLESILIIEVEWFPRVGDVLPKVTKYADKDLDGIAGKIISLSGLDEVIKLDTGSSTANLNVVLQDHDGSIKALLDKYDLHKRKCRVLQYFAGLDLSDAFELFRGEISSPIVWSEGKRQISFDVLSRIYEIEAGFAPEEGQFQFIPDSLIGQPWPMCFGSPIHVPATKIQTVVTGTVMNSFGIPDATLRFKHEFAVYMKEQLIASYNYYTQVLNTILLNNTAAFDLQTEYANFIVNADGIKQTFEDLTIDMEELNKQIDKKISLFNSETDDTPRDQLREEITELKEDRDADATRLHDLAVQKVKLKEKDKEFKVRVQNLKHLRINVVGQLRKKCRAVFADYVKMIRLISELELAMQNQGLLVQDATVIMVGYDFPQNEIRNFEINKLIFSASMDGYDLSRIVPQPNYVGLKLGPRQDDDVTSFWLDESNAVDLTGMYLRLSTKRIVKVSSQQGLKVTVDLPRKSRNTRFQRRKVNYQDSQKVKDTYHANMDGLETGFENDEQIENLINIPPRDISPKIWNILNGGSNEIRVKLATFRNPDETFETLDDTISYVVLIYNNEEVTEPILFSDSASEIRQKILDSTLSIDNNDLNVEITETLPSGNWKEFKVKYNKLMRRLAVIEYAVVDADNQSLGKVSSRIVSEQPTKCTFHLNKEILKPGVDLSVTGYYALYCKGKELNVPIESDGALIEAGLLAVDMIENGELTITGGPITTSDIVITYEDTFTSIFIDTSHVVFKKTVNMQLVDLEVSDFRKNQSLNIYTKVTGGGASEYTARERDKLVEDAVDKDVNEKTIKEFRNKLRLAIQNYKEQENNGAIDQATREAVYNAASAFRALAKQIEQVDFINDEAFRLISDEEFDLLYDLETLKYQEFLNLLDEVLESFPESIDYEFTMLNIGTEIPEACTIIMPKWLNWLDSFTVPNDKFYETYLLPPSTKPFVAQVSDTIALAGAYQEKFVCNILPSTVLSVYAKKNIGGISRLIPLPTSYYTKNENENFGYYQCTTITLVAPLSTIDNSWEDNIYVTLTSSVGPNVCDVLEFLIETYTTLTVDTVSFAAVKILQTNYPVNFARLQKENVLHLCEDIAWQARCVLWIKQDKVYIRYLPEDPTPYKTITNTDIEQASFELSFTNTEELVTRYDITWRHDYAASSPYKMVIRRNLNRYNEVVDSHEIYIYNQRDLVYKSATFWSMRRGSTWKLVKFRLFHNNLDLETQDVILLDRTANEVSTDPVKAIITKATYNSDTISIDIEAWLPILAGQMVPYAFAFPMSVQDVYPLDSEIIVGDAGNPINIGVPELSQGGFDISDIKNRPRDFGISKLGDVDDELPRNPAQDFTELQYAVVNDGVLGFNVDTSSDVEDTDSKYDNISDAEQAHVNKHWGPEPTWAGYGRINELDKWIIHNIGESNESHTLTFSIYLTDGRKIIAVALNIDATTLFQHEDFPEIMEGLPVLIIYNKDKKQYEFQPPTKTPRRRP